MNDCISDNVDKYGSLIISFRDKHSKSEYTPNGTYVAKLSICHEKLNDSALIHKYLPSICVLFTKLW